MNQLFSPQFSFQLKPNTKITVIVGIGLIVHYESRQLMRVAKGAIKEIFHDPSDAFWTGRAMDLMFHGIQIDCNATSAYSKVICQEMQERSGERFRSLDNGVLMFSMFAGVIFEMILVNDCSVCFLLLSGIFFFVIHAEKCHIKWSLETVSWH